MIVSEIFFKNKKNKVGLKVRLVIEDLWKVIGLIYWSRQLNYKIEFVEDKDYDFLNRRIN